MMSLQSSLGNIDIWEKVTDHHTLVMGSNIRYTLIRYDCDTSQLMDFNKAIRNLYLNQG